MHGQHTLLPLLLPLIHAAPPNSAHCRPSRGIVACANQNEPNTNLSQFFIALEKCEWLDKKNTIFGKVVGDTIFNLARMNELDVSRQCGVRGLTQALLCLCLWMSGPVWAEWAMCLCVGGVLA